MHSFKNEPFLRFNDEAVKAQFNSELDSVQKKLGKHYPLIIGEEEIYTEEKITSINPSCSEQTVGHVAKASQDLAQLASAA